MSVLGLWLIERLRTAYCVKASVEICRDLSPLTTIKNTDSFFYAVTDSSFGKSRPLLDYGYGSTASNVTFLQLIFSRHSGYCDMVTFCRGRDRPRHCLGPLLLPAQAEDRFQEVR